MPPITETTNLNSIRFSSLAHLDEWSPDSDTIDSFRIPRERRVNYKRFKIREAHDSNYDPQVIVCHDYKGNYVENEDDSPIGYFPHKDAMHYFLQFPSLVDIFIYFSHNKVSVPPVTWTNALHRQGVLSLGTLLFEGTEDQKSMDALVERSESGRFKYVSLLVQLCQHYGFDGWLMNLETQFSHQSKANELVDFVESLRAELHLVDSSYKVIWYDSLISSRNRVFYQNGVTELNFNHFDSSDMFFTNYWWDEQTLKKNILNVGLQGVRKKLFVGIDVWGRGSRVGSGGFETGMAMKKIKLYSSNIALFAPAWTYENFDKEDFIPTDQQFWIDEIDDEHYPSGSVSTYVNQYTSPVYQNAGNSVFYTNFSQGEGKGFSVNGKLVYDRKWVNVGLQQPAPANLQFKKLDILKDQGYNGSSSLKVTVQKSVENSSKANIIELFKFEHEINSKNLNISVSFKHLSQIVKRDLILTLEITYYIERRFRSINKVREGVFRIPLAMGPNWSSQNSTFLLPKLESKEHFILSGAHINWVPRGLDESMTTDDYEYGEKSWIFVSGYNDMNTKYEFLFGELLVEGIDNIHEVGKVKRIKKTELNGEEVMVSWTDDDFILYWLVYVNASFVGVASVATWIVKRRDRVRIDCVTRSGKHVTGEDLFV